MKPSLFTIGYQGRPLDGFVRSLLDHSIEGIIDVRLRPSSRRPGFSKTALAVACGDAGIEYQHDPGLGTPAEIMAAFRKTGKYDWDGYVQQLDERPDALLSAIQLASDKEICLMCFEADPLECHRRFVADRLAAHLDLAKVDI